MTKVADTLMTALNTKTALAVTDIASGDLIAIYDASAAVWKVISALDLINLLRDSSASTSVSASVSASPSASAS